MIHTERFTKHYRGLQTHLLQTLFGNYHFFFFFFLDFLDFFPFLFIHSLNEMEKKIYGNKTFYFSNQSINQSIDQYDSIRFNEKSKSNWFSIQNWLINFQKKCFLMTFQNCKTAKSKYSKF